MRKFVIVGVALTAVLTVGTVTQAADAPARPMRAASADRNASDAVARIVSPKAGKGYTYASRRMTECLATYPGYDPRTDRVHVPGGPALKCTL